MKITKVSKSISCRLDGVFQNYLLKLYDFILERETLQERREKKNYFFEILKIKNQGEN